MCLFKKKSPKKVETTVTVVVEDSFYDPFKTPQIDIYIIDEVKKKKPVKQIEIIEIYELLR